MDRVNIAIDLLRNAKRDTKKRMRELCDDAKMAAYTVELTVETPAEYALFQAQVVNSLGAPRQVWFSALPSELPARVEAMVVLGTVVKTNGVIVDGDNPSNVVPTVGGLVVDELKKRRRAK